jgi:hypothetical protein
MSGFFEITLTLAGGSGGVQGVNVEVSSEEDYKGTVDMAYSYSGSTAPNFISPTSDSLYVPKGESANDSVSVGLNTGDSIVFIAAGGDGNIDEYASIVVEG